MSMNKIKEFINSYKKFKENLYYKLHQEELGFSRRKLVSFIENDDLEGLIRLFELRDKYLNNKNPYHYSNRDLEESFTHNESDYLEPILFTAVEKESYKVLEFLLSSERTKKYIYVNHAYYDYQEKTALELAVNNDMEKMVELLLKHGANPSYCNQHYGGDYMISSAIRHENKNIIRLLVKYGYDITKHKLDKSNKDYDFQKDDLRTEIVKRIINDFGDSFYKELVKTYHLREVEDYIPIAKESKSKKMSI